MTKLMANQPLPGSVSNDKTDIAVELNQALKSVDTGKGHSADQVFGWLDDWASGQKRPIPNPDVFPNE